jgi:hypothetical protein
MSALLTKAALDTAKIKKNFPDAGPLLSQLTTNITTTYSAAAPYKQTDATGIKELTVSPTGTAGAGAGVRVSFDAPNDAVATDWFAEATTDSRVLQYVFVPAGTTRTFNFDPAIIRWDYVGMVNTMTVNEEVTR